jgi:hypothetical protein
MSHQALFTSARFYMKTTGYGFVFCNNAVLFYLFFFTSIFSYPFNLLIQQKKNIQSKGSYFFLFAVL